MKVEAVVCSQREQVLYAVVPAYKEKMRVGTNPSETMPPVKFTEQEVECLRFLAKHYDQESEDISIHSIPGSSEKMLKRFERYGLVKRITSGSLAILPKLLDEVHQLDNPAISPMQYGIFISYASEDATLAAELKIAFEQRGVRCFMAAENLIGGTRWEPAIRKALMASQRVLLLLTTRSKDRRWVLLEVGAAWALGIDIVPALVQVSPSELEDPIRQHQARIIETSAQRDKLVEDLASPSTDSRHEEPDAWNEFFRHGETLMETDSAEAETLTSAVLSMRR